MNAENLRLSGIHYYPPKNNWNFDPLHIICIICGVIILVWLMANVAHCEEIIKGVEIGTGKEHLIKLNEGVSIVRDEEEPDWDKLVPIIIQIESGGNPTAISKDGCIGLMQISPIVLKEWSSIYASQEQITSMGVIKIYDLEKYYLENDLFNPTINVEIGTWYLKRIWFHYLPHYHIPQTIDNLLIAYNWGIGNLVKFNKKYSGWECEKTYKYLPKETRNYLIKYHKLAGVK